MSILFPGALDAFTRPLPTDRMNQSPVKGSQVISNIYDAIELFESVIGITSSLVNTTLVYKSSEVLAGDKFVGKTAVQTLTFKTLTSPTITNASSTGTDAGIETQVNKTFTAPVINSPKINEAITMTSSSTELNFNDGSIAGTSVASKTLVLGASKNTDLLVIDKAIKFFAQQGFLLNGKFVPSVSSNNLTVAIKTAAGTDPSATDPVYCRIGDTIRTITAALSVPANAATNWFNSGATGSATNEIDYFVYLGYNSTDGVVIGFSRIPYAQRYNDFNTTQTNDKFCRISTITNAAVTDYYENIGRFAATLSATASFNWSVPTYTGTNLIQHPITETRELVYPPTFSPQGGGGFTPALKYNVYQIMGHRVFLRFTTNAHTISGTVTAIFYTLPLVDGATATLAGGDFIGVEGCDLVTGKFLYGQFITGGAQHNLVPGMTGNFIATAGAGYMGVTVNYSLIG